MKYRSRAGAYATRPTVTDRSGKPSPDLIPLAGPIPPGLNGGLGSLCGVDPTVVSPAAICADARGLSAIGAAPPRVGRAPPGQSGEATPGYHVLASKFILKDGRPPSGRSRPD